MSEEIPDILIAGGGSAGCVLAARLSEDPSRRVLLVEAGPDLPPDNVPKDIASAYPGRAYFNTDWLWPGLRVSLSDAGNAPAPDRPFEQARILGGGSSINGIGANRGAPSDYDGWAEMGAEGWGWSDVLPYFRKLERDLELDGELHGRDGPLPIRRIPRSDWSGFVHAAARSFGALGFAQRDDQNGVWEDGVFPITVNLDENGQRASAATSWLPAAVRARSNLRILTRSPVARLLIEDGRAAGVVLTDGRTLRAREVIVSAGAIGSPFLLQRSGIGPGAVLREAGIAVAVDRPGVGANLQEHPAIGLSAWLGPGARLAAGPRYHIQAILRFSSGMEGVAPGDMHVGIQGRAGWHAIGQRLGSFYLWVNRSFSTGHVRVVGGRDLPAVEFRMLSDPRDLVRLREGFRLGVRAMAQAPLREATRAVFPTAYTPKIKKLLAPSLRNGVLTAAAAPLMDTIPALRDRVIGTATGIPYDVPTLAADTDLLDAHLRRHVAGVWHPSGTCRMGRETDPAAVTDPQGRVIGVPGLRVCDASLMPAIPCANLNVPVLMMAEKIADAIRRSRVIRV